MSITKTDSLYRKDYFGRIHELKKHAPNAFESFFAFNNQALAEGELSVKVKELIAVAVAHITGCPYCIDLHVKNVKKQKASKAEVAEAIFVATALKAGSSAAHGVNALNAYDENGDEELYKASYFNRIKEFSKLNKETFKAFLDFDHQAIKAENLSEKEKRVNCSSLCPYNRLCILY